MKGQSISKKIDALIANQIRYMTDEANTLKFK